MIEYEAKFRVKDVNRVKERLTRLGERLGVRVEEDTYYEHPCRSFKERDEALRVREGAKAEVTYKGPRLPGRLKAREEITVRVSDAKRAKELLERLGFRRVAVVRKVREVYRVGPFEVTLDSVEGLGDFVEIELKERASSLKEAEEKVLALARELGIEEEPIKQSYLELILGEQ